MNRIVCALTVMLVDTVYQQTCSSHLIRIQSKVFVLLQKERHEQTLTIYSAYYIHIEYDSHFYNETHNHANTKSLNAAYRSPYVRVQQTTVSGTIT